MIGNRKGKRNSRIDFGLAKRLNREAERETKEEPEIETTEERNNGLEYGVQGKPKLNLTPLELTAVHTPSQNEYDDLIQVYECGGWKSNSGNLPTSINYWMHEKEETCVRAKEIFAFWDIESYQKDGWDVISPQEFYNEQGINQEQIQEINKWFENQPESK